MAIFSQIHMGFSRLSTTSMYISDTKIIICYVGFLMHEINLFFLELAVKRLYPFQT